MLLQTVILPFDSVADRMLESAPWIFGAPFALMGAMFLLRFLGPEVWEPLGKGILGLLAVVVTPVAIAVCLAAAPFVGVYYLATMKGRRAARDAAVARLLLRRSEFDAWLQEQLLSARIEQLSGAEGAQERADQLEAATLANARATLALQGQEPPPERPPGLGRPYSMRAKPDYAAQEAALEEAWAALKPSPA